MCELLSREWSFGLEQGAQRAVDFIQSCRNPYGAWRYHRPPNGDNDTSVTGWASLALHAAEEAGLRTSDEARVGALNWFYEVVDPANGRVGYDSIGSYGARVPGVNDHYVETGSEAMTAVALACLTTFGNEQVEEHMRPLCADLLLRKLPEWAPEDFEADVYYAYFGTAAMSRMGGRHWKAWRQALSKFALESQREDGGHLGSWDPVGPWGTYGGRVYSTAMLALGLATWLETDSR